MKLLIGGDVVPNAGNDGLFINGDAQALFGRTCELAKKADRVIINLECALTNCGDPIPKIGPNLKGVPECVNALKAFGVTDAMLSNNHVFDFGVRGLRETVSALEGAGIRCGGIGENDTDSRKPYIIDDGKEKIGIINVCEHEYSCALPDRVGSNPFDPFLTMQDIRELKKQTDHVIVIYHGGKEQCRYPSPRLYRLCHEMVLCGAEVVLTQHSHCIGCYEQFEGGHILYGQGNFVFCSRGSLEGWHTGLLAEIDTEGGISLKLHPFRIYASGVDLAEGADRDEIMSEFKKRNEELKDGRWLRGWHDFCESKREAYTAPLRALSGIDLDEKAREGFAHRLICEAHSDVWLELFPTWNLTNEKNA